MKCEKCSYDSKNAEIAEVMGADHWQCPVCGNMNNIYSVKFHSLRPPHYTKGKDTFAWAEQTLTKEACLAIAAFNIHKYNTRDKGQDYEDFGKIIDYANWARSLMEDD